ERDVARRPRRAAGRVDAGDLVAARAHVRADRVLRRHRRPQLLLLGEREVSDGVEAARGGGVGDAELLAVEGRAVEEIRDLLAVGRVVGDALLLPGPGLDLGREDHDSTASAPAAVLRSYVTASSACDAMRNPSGCCCSSARWASRPPVRARIGTALTAAAGKPRSSMTAAIGIATFIVSGRPQASAAASRNARASATFGPAAPRASASSRIRSARGSRGRWTGWPKPGSLPRAARMRWAISLATAAASRPSAVCSPAST